MPLSKTLGILCLLVLIVGGAALLIQRSTRTASPSIVVGGLFPMTGGLAQYGDLASKSSLLAIEELNRAGGVQGQTLVLDVQDHQCKPAVAVDAYKQLSSVKGVRYFLAAGCSGTVIAINPLLDRQVILGSTISSPKVSGTSPRFFRNYGTDSAEGKLFAEVIRAREYGSVSVLHEETDYAKGLMLSLKESLASSTLPFTVESFTSESTDVRTQITKLREVNADVFFLSPQTVTTANIALKQMQELGYKPKQFFVNENVMKSEQLRTTFPDLLNGAISADFTVKESEKLQTFLSAYKQRFGTECAQVNVCATAYDNVYLLAEAMKTVGTDDAEVVRHLKTILYEGVSGQISFDQKNDRSEQGYRLFKIENGQQVQF